MSPGVVHREDQRRFASEDGEAFIEYHMRPPPPGGRGNGVMDLQHTYVPPSKRGQGLAGKLTEAALLYARQAGFSVLPTCSYVSDTFLPQHPEFSDVVAR